MVAAVEQAIDQELGRAGRVELLWAVDTVSPNTHAHRIETLYMALLLLDAVAASVQANPAIMLRLGQCYDQGSGGLASSKERAVACYRLAAECGEPRACVSERRMLCSLPLATCLRLCHWSSAVRFLR